MTGSRVGQTQTVFSSHIENNPAVLGHALNAMLGALAANGSLTSLVLSVRPEQMWVGEGEDEHKVDVLVLTGDVEES